MGLWDKWFGAPKDEEEPHIEKADVPEADDNGNARELPSDSEALFRLGDYYRYGQGIPEDYLKAFLYYKKAAEQGHAQAQFALGCCYCYGRGTEKDPTLANHWFDRAAEQGIPEAQFNTANDYEAGIIVEKNMAKALYWYKKAAKQGLLRAMLKVAEYYADGIGGEGMDIDGSEHIYEQLRPIPKNEDEEAFWQELGKKLHYLKHHTQSPSEKFFGINLAAINNCLRNQQITINETDGGDKDAGH